MRSAIRDSLTVNAKLAALHVRLFHSDRLSPIFLSSSKCFFSTSLNMKWKHNASKAQRAACSVTFGKPACRPYDVSHFQQSVHACRSKQTQVNGMRSESDRSTNKVDVEQKGGLVQ